LEFHLAAAFARWTAVESPGEEAEEKMQAALREHVARYPEDAGRDVADFDWINRLVGWLARLATPLVQYRSLRYPVRWLVNLTLRYCRADDQGPLAISGRPLR
jgi:hypothetical protein